MNVDIIDEPLMEFLLQQNQFLPTRKPYTSCFCLNGKTKFRFKMTNGKYCLCYDPCENDEAEARKPHVVVFGVDVVVKTGVWDTCTWD